MYIVQKSLRDSTRVASSAGSDSALGTGGNRQIVAVRALGGVGAHAAIWARLSKQAGAGARDGVVVGPRRSTSERLQWGRAVSVGWRPNTARL